MNVTAVNRKAQIALLSDGQVIPVTNWFWAIDGTPMPCDPEDAVSAMAGPCEDGKYYSIDLTEYDTAQKQ